MVQPQAEMPGEKWRTIVSKAPAIPRRQPTRRLDERKMLALAADRLAELIAPKRPGVYDTGTENLIRDLRMLAGQR